MHLTKTFSVLKRFNLHNLKTSTSVVNNWVIKRNATTSSVEETGEPSETSIGEERKVMKGPFIKNLFVGNFDPDILEYPEYPSLEYNKAIDNLTRPVKDYFEKCIDSKQIDENKEIPEEVLNTLKEQKLFGLQVPRKLGGLELDDKCTSLHNEIIGTDISVSTSIIAQNRSLNLLLLHGNEYQKEEFVKKIATGEISCGFCLVEKPNILDVSDLETVALPKGNDGWILNGKKIWVTNGNTSDYFMVFAKTWSGTLDPERNSKLSVFLVDKKSNGVICSPNVEQLGTKGVNLCDVTFKDVIIPKEYLVGEMGIGHEIAVECLSRERLGAAAAAVGYLKNLVNLVTDYLNKTKIGGKSLSKYEYYQRQLGQIGVDVYGLESMVYLTAGLKDEYDNPDISIEETVVKLFSMEKIVEIVDLCANMIGGYSYIKDSPLEQSIRDSRSYLLHDIIPMNITKVYVATHGIHHAGMNLQEAIKKIRNPVTFPGFALKQLFKDSISLDNDMKIPQQLRLQLHPSLAGDADKLERSAIRLEFVVRDLLKRWGAEIIDRHMDLIRLTDCVMSIYAMTAVLGRCSRAYCIGLRNTNTDLAVCNVFCQVHHDKIKDNIDKIFGGPVDTNDAPYLFIGEQLSSNRGYLFSHPLERNY